ncbi:MAG: hypothetical protein ACREHG_09275, partial [Candidatus Saccharimonadales bacterium]
MSDLGSNVWANMASMSPRLRHFLLFLLRTRIREVEKLQCVGRVWPLGLKVDEFGWSVRTRRRLEGNGLLNDLNKLTTLTIADLLEIEGMGVLSILDFCSTTEGAIDYYEQLTSSYASERNTDNTNNILSELESTYNEIWSSQISEQDPRFAKFLSPGKGTLYDRLDRLISEPDEIDTIVQIPSLLRSISVIKKYAETLLTEPLEDSLLNFLKLISKSDGDRLDVLAQRLGWKGHEIVTLDECGKILGITRERIRQMQNKIIHSLPDHEIFMPRLDQALTLLEENAPINFEHASTLMQQSGITRELFHPNSLLEAAKLLGKNTTLSICETRTGKLLVNGADNKLIRQIQITARKLAGQSGATNVFFVLDALKEQRHIVEEDYLLKILHSASNFHFLNNDWFLATDIPIARNRLRNVARKILSLQSPQTVISI